MGSARKIVCPFPASVLVGVSGGVDSVTLADMLHRQGTVGFAVAHCNFHLRGEESDGDAEFVRGWAAERGVRCHSIDFDTKAYAASRKISIEMAARELRYGWFALLCRESGYGAVAIAHNANDNAETLILNLVRGTGLRGICGMQEMSVQTVSPAPRRRAPELAAAIGCGEADFPETLNIWRPLLGMTRPQIEGYARKHGLKWREDRTNKDSEYKRNLVRNEIMPLLERLNPSAVKVLNRDMRHFAEAGEIVDAYFGDAGADSQGLCPNDYAECGRSDGLQPEKVLLERIVSRGRGWRYALYLYLEKYSFSGAVIAQVEDLLDSGRTVSGKIFCSPTHRLIMSRSSLILEPLTLAAEVAELVVNAPGEYRVNGGIVKVELFDRPENYNPKQPEGVTAVDADKVGLPVILRTWREGDWMRPLGCRGRKKISDLFADLKFSLPGKRSAILLERPSEASSAAPASYRSVSPSEASPAVPASDRPTSTPANTFAGIPAGTFAETSAHTPADCLPTRSPHSSDDTASASSGRVLALLGLRIDESVRITPETRRILRFTLR